MTVMRRSKRLTVTVAPLVLGALVLGGVGVAVAAGGVGEAGPTDPTATLDQHTGDPVTYSSNTSVPARAMDPTEASQQVVQSMGSSSPVRGVAVAPDSGGPESDVSVTLAASGEDEVVDQWYSSLALGAVAELMRDKADVLSDEVGSASFNLPDKDGGVATTGLGVGAVSLGQNFNSPSDGDLSQHIQDVATQFGLKVSSTNIIHPLESAVRVSFVVPDGQSPNWSIDQLRQAIVGNSPSVEGVLIELDSQSGDPLLRSAVAYRTGEGDLWFAPGQDRRFGAVHGGLFSEATK